MKNKKAILLFLVTIISVLLGFIKESSIVFTLGVSWNTDLFIFSSDLPIILFSAIGTVLSTTFMPIFTELRLKYSEDEANSFATHFSKYIFIVCTIVTILGEIFPKVIVKIMVPGLINIPLINYSIRIVLPSIIILSLLYVFIGILNSYNKVIITSAIQIPMHLTIIFSMLFVYKRFGFKMLLAMIPVGAFLQLLLIYIFIKNIKFKFLSKSNLTNRFIKEAFIMMGPMAIGVMAMQLNAIVASNIASKLGQGSITIINLANKLSSACYNTGGYLIVIMIFPILSEYAARKDYKSMETVLDEGLIKSVMIIIPMVILMVILGKDIISLFFGNNHFSSNDINKTSNVLAIYSLGLLFWSIKDILNRVFYSLKETKISMINGIITVIINVIFCLILANVWGIIGIAMASTLSSITAVLLLLKKLKNINIKLNICRFRNFILKMIIPIAGMILSVFFMNSLSLWNCSTKLVLFMKLASISIISIGVYGLLLIVVENNEVKRLIKK